MPWTTRYTYPGDPTTEVQLMFGGEFLVANPNREIVVGGDGMPTTRIPVEEIVCDTCNVSVFPDEPCAITESRLYCWSCYKQWIRPHLVGAA